MFQKLSCKPEATGEGKEPETKRVQTLGLMDTGGQERVKQDPEADKCSGKDGKTIIGRDQHG